MENTFANYKTYAINESALTVEKIHILSGANYFSAGPVVLIRLNLGIYNEVFTNQIPNFPQKLEQLLPSLYEHHCSVGKPGGFLLRVNEGTLLGHVIEHVAIELQTLAGMDVGYGKTRSTLTEGVYNIIFRFLDEEAGIFAGKAAVNLISSLLNNTEFDVASIIDTLIRIREQRLLGPSTQAIVKEAESRKIPWLRLDTFNLVQLGTGMFHKTIRATVTSDTNFIAVETADDKYLTNLMLADAGIPVPFSYKSNSVAEILELAKEQDNPIVVKPCKGAKGHLLSINIQNEQEIINACKPIIDNGNEVLLQTFHQGNSYRLLVIDYKFAAATLVKSPFVIGNGESTIEQLIEQLNQSPERQFGDKGQLSAVETNDDTIRILSSKGYNLKSIIAIGEILNLKNSGNLQLGGSAFDVTDIVNPFNIYIAERAARTIGLNVAGIDIISPDISIPLNQNNGVVIEVNAAPDFRMHLTPYSGESRNVAAKMLDLLFPELQPCRIPLISITGSYGKTTAAHFLNFCFSKKGKNTGLASSKGIFINNRKICDSDLSLPNQVSTILRDKTIDFAILETTCESILNKGLAYEFADIGVFLNVSELNIGTHDIKYIEDMAYAKSVVPEQVYESGFSVLNADDAEVMEVLPRLYSKPVLFTNKSGNIAVQNSIAKGNTAVYIENEQIFCTHRSQKQFIIPLSDLAVDFFNEQHIIHDSLLASIAVLIVSGFEAEQIAALIIEFKQA